MTTVEIIFLIIALAFIALVIFAIKLITNLVKTLKKVNHILDSLGQEPKNIVHHVNEISVSCLNKMRKMDPLFNAISNFGHKLEHRSASSSVHAGHLWKHPEHKAETEDTISDCINMASLGVKIWQRYNK